MLFIPQVGAVVEVKSQDGVYQEATINKLTDASIYTVGMLRNTNLSFPLSTLLHSPKGGIHKVCCLKKKKKNSRVNRCS